MIYAGEDGASRDGNKKTRYGNFAPRLGMTYDLFGDGTTILRTGFAHHLLPRAAVGLEHDRPAGAVHDLAERQLRDQSDRLRAVRTIDNPFPAIAQVKPRTTAELQAANPRVLGHSFENETPYAEQWHLGIERRLFCGDGGGARATPAAPASTCMFCYNPNEVQPGIGTQESRRLIQPLRTA